MLSLVSNILSVITFSGGNTRPRSIALSSLFSGVEHFVTRVFRHRPEEATVYRTLTRTFEEEVAGSLSHVPLTHYVV